LRELTSDSLKHSEFNKEHSTKLNSILQEEEKKVVGIEKGTLAVGVHYLVSPQGEPIVLTLGVPGYGLVHPETLDSNWISGGVQRF
jgi:hypothetical protein